MDCKSVADGTSKKKHRANDREMTTALFLLRCVELGISLSDLDEIETGTVLDMYIEKSNDNEEYPDIATQDDFDRF